MFCRFCGNQLNDMDQYCPECGGEIDYMKKTNDKKNDEKKSHIISRSKYLKKVFIPIILVAIVIVVCICCVNRLKKEVIHDENNYEKVDAKINDILSKDNFFENDIEEQKREIEKVLSQLEDSKQISNVEFDNNNKLFSYEYKDGTLGGVSLFQNDDYFYIGKNEKTYISNADIVTDVGKNGNERYDVKILYAVQDDFLGYFKDIGYEWGTDLVNVDVDYDVTLDDLRNLGKQDIYMFTMHGATYRNEPVLVIDKDISTIKYLNDLLKKDVAKVRCKDGWRFFVFQSFFRNNYEQNYFDGSIVSVESCKFFGCDCEEGDIDYKFSDMFIDYLSAEVVMGFRNSVLGKYSVELTNHVFYDLMKGYDIEEALNRSLELYGNTDGKKNIDEDKYEAYAIIRGNKEFRIIKQNLENTYNNMKTLYEEGDYYNAMLLATEILKSDEMKNVDYYIEIKDLYDICYVEMQISYLEVMEQLYRENNSHDYEMYRQRMQQIYGGDTEAVEEINAKIKLFSTRYLVLQKREIGDYGDGTYSLPFDNTYTYIYDDINGIVSVEDTYIAPNLQRPELKFKIEFYNTETVQFHNQDNIITQYNTYIDNTKKVELTFDDSGRVIDAYYYNFDDRYESYTEYEYDEDGKCRYFGDDELMVDMTYDEKGQLTNMRMFSINEEFMNVNYYYDEQSRLTSYEGISWGYSCYGGFVYDDNNKIVYYYESEDHETPRSIMYYDERGVCYKEVTQYSEIAYEYREISTNPEFENAAGLYIE